MDVEIVSKKENPVLKRTEVAFKLNHPKEKTPQRLAVRDKLAASLGAKREGIIIVRMRSHFGAPATVGYAKVYDSSEAAKKIEPQHLLKRHGLVEAKPAEGKPGEKPAEKKAEAKPAEKHLEKKAEAKPAEKPAEKKAEPKPAEKPVEKKPAEKK